MSSAHIIDMSKLPAPAVVVMPAFEKLVSELKADLIAAMPQELRAATVATLALESEPLTKWTERLAYQLVVEHSARNDSAHAVMLAYAKGSDLDHLGVPFGVERLTIIEANPAAFPPIEAVMEDDEAFRMRIQLAPRGFSVAGPVGAYIFHAKSADGQVLDAAVSSPEPGRVVISVLAREGSGEPTPALLDAVHAAVNADDVRPLTDDVVVQAAGIVPWRVAAKLHMLRGADPSVVLTTANQRAAAYADEMHRIGSRYQPTMSGIYAALHVEGVQRVELTSPTADVVVGDTQASWCTAITVTNGRTNA